MISQKLTTQDWGLARGRRVSVVEADDLSLRRVKLLKAGQVAELIGVNVATVWRWTQRLHDPLPVVRFGGRCTRFPLMEVEKWIERQQRSRQ